MNNPFDELEQAMRVAKETRRSCEMHADSMASLLDGNLRGVSRYRLARLKKELNQYNIHTGRWKP
jgi:hypothetical protein